MSNLIKKKKYQGHIEATTTPRCQNIGSAYYLLNEINEHIQAGKPLPIDLKNWFNTCITRFSSAPDLGSAFAGIGNKIYPHDSERAEVIHLIFALYRNGDLAKDTAIRTPGKRYRKKYNYCTLSPLLIKKYGKGYGITAIQKIGGCIKDYDSYIDFLDSNMVSAYEKWSSRMVASPKSTASLADFLPKLPKHICQKKLKIINDVLPILPRS